MSFASQLIPQTFQDALISQLVHTILSAASIECRTRPAPSVLNHPPQTKPFHNPTQEKAETALLHSQFVKRAQESPDSPALDFLQSIPQPGETGDHDIYTYAELDYLSSELAGLILQLTQSATLNCGRFVVPAFLSTSPELYICWLAVLKASCAFCPLPIDAPLERLQGILDETASTVVLGRGAAPENLAPLFSFSADLPRQWIDVTSFVAARRRTNPAFDPADSPRLGLPSIKGEDLAYVMYTSGSTGKPKGVQITHHAAACSISSHVEFAPRTINGQPPRWFQFAAPTFDPSVMEIFTTLSIGGTLCFCERIMSLTDPEAAITALSATIMMATPSMAALLRPRHVPTLKHLWTMGEALGRKVIENFASDSFLHRDEGDVRYLLNAYGPTEGSINCTLQADFSVKQRGSNIGDAIATCSMLVLDPDCCEPKPVPLGFSGELAIGGPQVSPGYLNRPQQTAAAFVDSAEFGRVYRTGDRARIVEGLHGSFVIDFLGRITTDQVKLSGRRVDLGDIEAALASLPDVVEVAAVAHQQRQGEKGSEHIVVCVVPGPGSQTEKLLQICQARADSHLQPYMRPKRYFIVDFMPRSASGKIDRKRISAMVSAPDNSELTELLDHVAPAPSTTTWAADKSVTHIIGILADVTGVSIDEIAPTSGILSIGLDSLRAVKFLQQLRNLNIHTLAISDVLTQGTVANLVALCTGSKAVDVGRTASSRPLEREGWASLVATYRRKHLRSCLDALSLEEDDVDTILPTTSTQAGMLASFLRSQQTVDTAAAAPASYINHSVYEIAPGQNVDLILRAWGIALSRNEMLRTVFVQVDEELSPFAQCVLAPSSIYASNQVEHYTGEDYDDLVQTALKTAEQTITLERPAFRIALVSTTIKNAIVLSLAHPIFDGGSLQLLVQDVEREFRNLEPLSRTSINAAVARHFSSDREASAAYWRKELEGNVSEPFPCLLSHQTRTDKDVPDHSIVLSEIRLSELRQKARQLAASPLAILHAAWSLVLFAYTGTTSDVTFGSVVSDRLDEDMARCSAPTFVTVPMRVSLPLINTASAATVADVALSLTKANIDSLAHLHTPLSSVLNADGGLPYDTLFAFQDFPADNAAEGGIYTKVTYPPMKNDFAAMIEVWPTSSGLLELKATFDRKLLDTIAAKCMIKQLEAAIHFILEQPDKPFLEGKVAMPQAMLSGFPAAWSEVDDEQMILHAPFEKHAAAHPDDLALLFHWDLEGEASAVKMTYQELNEAAEDLSRDLVSEFGTFEGRVVPLCMEKCPELYIAVLGVLKAGGAWCPVDPYSPPARQHDIIKRAEASVVLVAHSMSKLPAEAVPEGVQAIDITSCWTRPADSSTQVANAPRHSPSNIAYLIFTSGTTGPPKGVPITHAAGFAAMKSLSEIIPPSPSNMASHPLRCMQFSQFTFDVFVQDLFYTWRCGGAVISATRELMIGSFARLANLTGATHAHLTPAFGSTVARKDIETLRVVTMIGEKLGQSVADDWGTNMLAYNTYGPAEAAVVSTVRQFGADGLPTDVRSSNVGWPLPSLGAYVIDNGRPVMKHAIGELVLSGVQLSKGYWAAPEISATKMVYNEALGQEIYHTGDFCRQLADGSFDFVGRNDDLVKIAGQRVELSEIAHACRDGHPLVDQIEVLYPKRPGSDVDNILVCFVAAKALSDDSHTGSVVINSKSASEIAASVLQKVQSLLPKHMIPTVILVLNKIPRTPSAKVDRKELVRLLSTIDMQQWDDSYKGRQAVIVNTQESQWAEQHAVLVDAVVSVARTPKEEIKPTSSLAALGIDSIKAIRLTAKLRAASHQVSVLDVFRCRTLNDISTLLSPTKENSTISKDAAEKQSQAEEDWRSALREFHQAWYGPACLYLQKTHFKVAPTSTTQEGMLTESMRRPLSYWGVHSFELSPNADIEKLRRAWFSVTSQTEALRTGFVPVAALPEAPEDASSTFVQVIYDNLSLPWSESTVEDGKLGAAIRVSLEELATRSHSAGFSIPPWQIDVVESGEKHYMVLYAHHALYDGNAMDILETDLRTAYDHLHTKINRCQLSEAMTRITLGADEATAAAFWKKELQGFDSSEGGRLMNSKNTDDSGSITHRTQEIQMGISTKELSTLSHSLQGLSKTTILRVAFGQMLSELMESPDVLFAEIKSDRVLDPRLEDVVAPLVSVIPVPFRSTGSPKSLIKDQHRLASEGVRFRSVRSSLIRNLTGKSASEPLYPAVFVYHPRTSDRATREKQVWSRMDDLVDIAVEHPLVLNAFDHRDGATILSFSVDERLMSATQQNVFLRQIDALVTAIASRPDEDCISNLTEYFPRELQSVSAPRENNNCPADFMPTLWIGRWALEHPEWKAVEVASAIYDDNAETTWWTYAELDRRSNQVAAYIGSYGIAEQMIGMCLDATLISFAVLIGIMKSGNTYVPIEKDLPQERKMFLLEDSAAPMLFTSGTLFDCDSDHRVEHIVDVESAGFLESLNMQPSKHFDVSINLDGNAYLLYTSGSTGKPKGVRVSRRNLSSFMEGQSQLISTEVPSTPGLAGKGKYLCLASRAFDVHLGETFLAWRHGLCAVTAPRTMLLDDLELALRNLHVTHASFVPSLLDQTGLRPEDVPELRFLGVGGEKMTPRTQAIWAAPRPGSSEDAGHQVSLINAYGPTEATIGCCSGRLYKDRDTQNIGRPLGDCIAHVLAPGSLAHVKRGMPGELCFTGSFVANGYHNRPDATGFVNDFHGQKMYRTGDIVALMPDDTIYFLGRKDDQVKVRGQRLELGEVSEAVRAAAAEAADLEAAHWDHKKIDVQTLLIKHPDFMRQQLVSFVAAAGASKHFKNGEPSVFLEDQFAECDEALRPIVQRTHPAYMVPDLIVPVSYMPLTQTSAKADTKLLKSLFSSIPASKLFGNHHGQEEATDGVESTTRELTPQEKNIVEIAQSYSSTKSDGLVVAPTTTIFQLGVDSLGAISVYARMKKMGYECSVATILSGATIEQLAALPTKKKASSRSVESETSTPELSGASTPLTDIVESIFLDSSTLSGIEPGNVANMRPCLPLQEVLVAQSMARDDEEDALYVNHIVLQLSEDVDIARLVNSWDRVIAANEILRTCFRHTDKGVVQVVFKPEASPLVWSQTRRSADVKQVQKEISRQIIRSIESQPPIRLTLRLADNTLTLSMHHALYDGESLPMIIEDVESTYLAGAAALRPSIQPLVNYVSHKRTHDNIQTRQYWVELLSGWTPAELATASSTDGLGSPETTVNTRAFTRSLASLEQDCAKLSLTLPALLQGVFGICLAQNRGYGSATYGTVLSGRTIPVESVERMVAPCIVTLPQRVNLRNVSNAYEAVTSSQKAGFEVLNYQHSATRDIQAWLGLDQPLFDAIFSFSRKAKTSDTDHWLMKECESQMTLDYALAVECEADSEHGKLVVRSGFTPVFGSSSDVDMLMEKMELLAEAILRGEKPDVGNFADLGAATGVSAVDRAVEETEWTSLQSNIREVVASFCNIPSSNITKTASFIHMGVDSVTAIPFSRKLRAKDIKVTASQVIRARCIGTLAEQLAAKDKLTLATVHQDDASIRTNLRALVGAKPWADGDEIEVVYPCTPLQTGMLSLTLATDPRLYSHHHVVALSSDLDICQLKRAWTALILKCDILRTGFHWRSGSEVPWAAVVHKQPLIRWETVRAASIDEGLRTLDEQTQYSRHEDFEPTPVKATVISDNIRSVFVLSMHHVTYDGMSVPLLFEDLQHAYLAENLIERPAFSQAALAIASTTAAASEFWSRQMQGFKGSNILLSSKESTATSLTAKRLEIPIEATARFAVSDVAMVAFAKALSCIVGARDVVFGQVVSGRNIAVIDADKIIGPMFNTVPFRLRFSQALATNADVLRQVRQMSEEAIDFQHASLAEVQKLWRQQNGVVSAPNLFDSLFVFQKTAISNHEVESRDLWHPYEGEATAEVPAEYALNFEVEQTEQGLVVQAYSKLNAERLASFMHDFKVAFADLISSPTALALRTPKALAQTPLEIPLEDPVDTGALKYDTTAIDYCGTILINAVANFANTAPEQITLDTSIFSLGIDSISAITIVSVCKRKGLKLSVVDIIQGITIGRICELAFKKSQKPATSQKSNDALSAKVLLDDATKLMALTKLGLSETVVEDVLPVLSGQEYHLTAWLKSGRTLYEPSWVVRTRQPLDVEKLRQTWAALRTKHTILRSSFVATSSDRAVQVVMSPASIDGDGLNFTVSETGPGGLEAATMALAHKIARAPSDMFTPPARLHLVQGGEEGNAILVTVQHAAYDAWTMVRFLQQLEAAYQDKQIPEPAPFAGFVHHTRGEESFNDMTFWRQHLAAAESTIIKPLHQPSSPHSKKQSFVMLKGSKADLWALENAARKQAVTPQSLLVTAYAKYLQSNVQVDHPTFGLFHLGRSSSFENINDVYGPTINMLPFSISAGKWPLGELVAQAQVAMARRVPYEQSRLREVLASTGIQFNTALNLLWNDGLITGERSKQEDAPLFEPFAIGVPTDYSSPMALEGSTAVDELNTDWIADQNLFVDVAPDRETGYVSIGARCDAALWDDEELKKQMEAFEGFIANLALELNG